MNKRKTVSTKSVIVGAGADTQKLAEIYEKFDKGIRQKVTSRLAFINKYGDVRVPKIFKSKTALYRNKKTRYVSVWAASGHEDIPVTKLKIISDPVTDPTRTMLTTCALSDPLLAPALDRRTDALFEDGFHLELEFASMFDMTENRVLTKEETEAKFKEQIPEFNKILLRLETWKDDANLIQTIRDSDGVSIVQGRAAALVSPGIASLDVGKLPIHVEIIYTEDLGQPIVDVGLTRKLVAVQTHFEDKKICRGDEIIYITRGKKGLRKSDKFYGTPLFEPILTISKQIKRIYNYNLPEALVAAYVTKVLFTFASEGSEDDQKNRITKFINDFLTDGKLAFGMNQAIEKVQPIGITVDWDMLNGAENKLADAELAVVGVPKSMLNREHNLNRDIATIEAIQFVKFVRKPDEKVMSEAYQNQLFNPLFSHLMQKPLSEIPVRVKMVRNKPEGSDLDSIYENKLALQKESEINAENLEQKDATSPFGAASKNRKKKLSTAPIIK